MGASRERSREYWLSKLQEMAHPVLSSLAARSLKKNMPVEAKQDRTDCTYLEALARTLCGMAPWLELQGGAAEEVQLRSTYAAMAREAIDAITDPQSPDYIPFGSHAQTLVDAAFLAHAVLRAPKELWGKLDDSVRCRLIIEWQRTRRIRPGFSNWLLFSAMIETALLVIQEDYDGMRIDYGLRQHEQWYKGDGAYGDGPDFHWDYYNSYVIQPMLLDVIAHVHPLYGHEGIRTRDMMIARAKRYAAIQERLIGPDGTFPVIGRSITYRCGAFQLLAQTALQHMLPDSLPPAQVRCALQAVIERCLEAPGTYDSDGWLRIGLSGHQPSLGEAYISTGSLYLCSAVFLPLGLPQEDEFWSGKEQAWTSKVAWSGSDLPADAALE